MIITTNSGVTITVSGSFINCSDGKTYSILGNTLNGPDGIVSRNIKSTDEAVGIVIGIYGGKRM
jgi:hypothetical protein